METQKLTNNIVMYRKKYYAENKDYFFEEIMCDICGITYKKCNKSHHMKSIKHKYKTIELENELLKKKLHEFNFPIENYKD